MTNSDDIFTYKAIKTEHVTEQTILKMQCPTCGTMNTVPVTKINLNQTTITLYQPEQELKCTKCNTTIAQPHELITPK